MDIEHVSKIARLKLSESEKKKFSKELEDILNYFKLIDKVDTKNVEPSFHAIKIKDVFREDNPEQCLNEKEVFKNAKEHEKGFFKSPRVV